ncbi:uncharacterized protein [Littorina saxatilis]|uniref:Endoglucanase n=2 Tax=Littorina saxatilis TaxID=31220 RepID=A0AAN9AU17_9CAEN
MMLAVVLLVLAPLAVLTDVDVPVDNHWSGGFQGKACFNIQQDMTSWKVHLNFHQPVETLEVWTAEIDSSNADKSEYTLSSKQWNANEHVGDQLCIDFLGHVTGDINPQITATMEGVAGGGTFQVTERPTLAPITQESLPPGVTRPPTTPMTIPDGEGVVATMTVKNDYPDRGGFEIWFDFDVDRIVEGWVMKVHFSKPVDSLKPGQSRIMSHNADGTEWILANTDDTLLLKPGDHFQLRLVGTSPEHTAAPKATAIMINMGQDNWTVTALPNKAGSKYNYDDVLMKSIMFYEAQRSGKLPANNRIPWRGDSALGDKGANGEDLSGGWYDAGDFVKFNLPLAWATVVLEWGFLTFKDAYKAAGQTEWMYEAVKWPLDYLLKCHVADDELYVQVGNGAVDHGQWGRPEDMTMSRPAYKIDASKPGSEVAMETASAFAAGYLLFKEKDAKYANTLLAHAKTLWNFAVKHQGIYSQSVSAASGFYTSANITDELCWGSLWMYKATGEQKYLDTAKQYYDPTPDWGMSWDDNIIGNQLLMYNLTGDAKYVPDIEGTFKMWFPGGSLKYSPKGLAYRLQWGSLRYASNMAFAALMAAEMGVHTDMYRHWAMCQIHYALGDTGRSFVVGFGKNPPKQPHHRSSSCPNKPALCNMNILHLDVPNVHTLYGALVGGPDGSDKYEDSRNNYVNNEVANDYNAGFQSAVAGLRHLLLKHQHPEQTGGDTCPFTSS